MDAVQLLLDAERSGEPVGELPTGAVPSSRPEAYAAQAAWARGERIAGWKIAATSLAGQRHLQVDGPLGGLTSEAMLVDPDRPISLAGNRMRLAELEFAFRLDRELAPRAAAYTVEEVVDAAGELLLSWELPSTRYADVAAVGTLPLILDNACGHRLALRPATEQDWKNADLSAVEVRASNSNGTVHPGHSSNALGDPRIALTWLVNELSAAGITVQAGQFMTTGVCTDPLPIAGGETITGDWGRFGSFRLSFVE